MALSLNKPKLDNLASDINGFSRNVDDIIEHFNYPATIGLMVKNNRLAPILNLRTTPTVSVVFWQTDEQHQPAIVTEPYQKTFSAANLKKEQEFHASDLGSRVRLMAKGEEKTVAFTVTPKDNAARKLKEALAGADETLAVEWTHRHYVQDDEYIPHGEDIGAFLTREIAKPIIRWEETKKDGKPILGYEILPNCYFYRYQPPRPAQDLLAEFWRLEKEAEKMLEGLAR